MHDIFLAAALEEAQLGQGFCAPNPSVGAVAVKEGVIIARAWHRGAGTPHAEALIIEQLPPNEPGVTLYVTLEPCNHHGRTPPCVDAIVRYGFEQVVFAYRDPNPMVAENNTPEQLRAQGITVLHYPCREIDAFYASYRYWTVTGKPWVNAKIAQSFDGKIGATRGARVKLSNEDCERFTHQHRLINDVIMTTARTVNADDPQFNVRLFTTPCSKPLAILDRNLTLHPQSQIFSTTAHCHIFYGAGGAAVVPEPTSNRTYYPVPVIDGLLDLESVMRQLGILGYHTVWLEAGGALFSSMHQARLVQRTYVYLVPTVLGEEAVSAYRHAGMFEQALRVSWHPMKDNMVVMLDWHESNEQEATCSQD